MKKTLRLTVLSLALIVGFATGVQGAQQQRAQTSELEYCLAECYASLGREGAEILGECKAGCWHSEAVRTKNPDKCDILFQEENYGGEGAYQNCVSDVASVVGDYKICRRIADLAWRDNCLARLATETGNVAICMEIQTRAPGDMRTQCHYGVALSWKRPEICDYIESKDVRDNCRRVVGGLPRN